MNKNIIITVLTGLVILLFFLWSDQSKKANESNNLVKSLNSSVRYWKDKEGRSNASTDVVQSSDIKGFVKMETRDKEIKKLQELVREYRNQINRTGSATRFGSNTSLTVTSPTVTLPGDTVETLVYPVYTSNFNYKDWVYGSVRASRDSTTVNIDSLVNGYSVVTGLRRKGFLSRKEPFVEVRSDYPYTVINGLKSFSVPVPKGPRVSFGGYAGYGATLYGGNIVTGPQAGGGLTVSF